MRTLYMIVMVIIHSQLTNAQDSTALKKNVLSAVHNEIKKSEHIKKRLACTFNKYVNRLSRQEQHLQRIISKRRPDIAEKVFSDINKKYQLRGMFTGAIIKINPVYNKCLDSLKTALLFIEKNNMINRSVALAALHQHYEDFQTTLNHVNYIRENAKQRQQLIREKLKGLGYSKYMNNLTCRLQKFQSQAEEYKLLFAAPEKTGMKVLHLVRNNTRFKQFFNKYSQLAALFDLPENNETPNDIAKGLQTYALINEEVHQRTGSDTREILRQNSTRSQPSIPGVENKLNVQGDGGHDFHLADGRPAEEEIKDSRKKPAYGFDIQNGRGSFLLPLSTDIGLHAGYTINYTLVIGCGLSYRIGWGKDIRQLRITHEAIGFRTFYEMKLKRDFLIHVAGEINYRSGFKKIDELKMYNLWQKMALLGISKKYRVSNKVSGNLQLLYDFLHSQQVPVTQQLILRAGYTF